MTTIKIDNKEYELESLSDTAKANLVSLQFVEKEIQHLQAQLAAFQTARMAYGRALQEALPNVLEAVMSQDTIKLG